MFAELKFQINKSFCWKYNKALRTELHSFTTDKTATRVSSVLITPRWKFVSVKSPFTINVHSHIAAVHSSSVDCCRNCHSIVICSMDFVQRWKHFAKNQALSFPSSPPRCPSFVFNFESLWASTERNTLHKTFAGYLLRNGYHSLIERSNKASNYTLW